MTYTLPTLSRTLDDKFMSIWYEVQPQAVDNILNANVGWAALKAAGCFKTQAGGDYINRSIRYGKVAATAVHKGSTFSQGEPKLKTGASWTWRYMSSHVQRSVFDDAEYAGKFKIADYVRDRLDAAKQGLEEAYETALWALPSMAEAGDILQGLNSLVPPANTFTDADGSSTVLLSGTNTGAFGKINRPLTWALNTPLGVYQGATGNTWWGSNYRAMTTPVEVNLISDMDIMYDACTNSQVPPNLIITDFATGQLYKSFALDMAQIVKDDAGKLVDLGFEVIRYRGKPIVQTNSISSTLSSKKQVLFLNTDFIEVVYNPGIWFEMTPWKDIALQGERIAHILCGCNILGTQPRRHGRLYEA